MVDLMTRDASKFQLQSWYFYGQSYFGNLHVILYTPFYWLFGGGVEKLQVYEHFVYWLSALVFFSTLPKYRWGATIVYGLGYFFLTVRFHALTYAQTYPFVIFLLACSYWLTHRGLARFYRARESFGVGLLTTLSLWHNILYLPVIGVYALSFGFTYFRRKDVRPDKYLLHQLAALGTGLGLGLIPLLLATRSTEGDNLGWFGASQSGEFVSSAKYWLREIVLYFTYGLEYSGLSQIKEAFLLNPLVVFLQFAGAGIILVFLASALFWVARHPRQEAVLGLWIVIIGLAIFRRGVSSESEVFLYGRYLLFWHGLIWLAVAKYCLAAFEQANGGWSTVVARFGGGFVSLYALVFAFTLHATAYTGLQSYQTLYTSLREYGIDYLYCEDYYMPCLSLVGQFGDEATVQILQSPPEKKYLSRNPQAFQVVDQALEAGEVVHALTQKNNRRLPREQVLGEYVVRGSVYELYTVSNE